MILSKGCLKNAASRRFAEKFDSEGGGYATHDSLSRSIHRLGIELSSDQLNGLIHFHDRNGNGFIEIASLVEVDRKLILKDGEESIELLQHEERSSILDLHWMRRMFGFVSSL